MAEQVDRVAPQALCRRTLLKAGTAAAGLLSTGWAARSTTLADPPRPARHCIWLMLTGAPGQIDTFDPKPLAPVDIRGPFRPIATRVPGVQLSEHFPQLAARADRLALVRGMCHAGPALHETGWRYALTGDDFQPPRSRPYAGSIVSAVKAIVGKPRPSVILGGRYRELGQNRWTGEFAGELGPACEALEASVGWAPPTKRQTSRQTMVGSAHPTDFDLSGEPAGVRDHYGRHELGENCLRARRLVQAGVEWIQVNHFPDLSGLSWDMHAGARRLCTTFDDYAQLLCPQLDQALSALLDDLESRGLLAETVVAVVAEMGRSPRINARGGREHHTSAWTNLIAGGPIAGGRVIGATDACGDQVVDRPTSPGELLATVFHALGIGGATKPYCAARPIAELF